MLRGHGERLHGVDALRERGSCSVRSTTLIRQSLLDLLRIRKRYTEAETRFYLVQLIGACDYMHSRSVIHRDLKLGNLLLDADMNLHVADFGLAALVRFPGERKKTVCGTPNYIAPEILFDQDNGHSFEVDIWSIGVILCVAASVDSADRPGTLCSSASPRSRLRTSRRSTRRSATTITATPRARSCPSRRGI